MKKLFYSIGCTALCLILYRVSGTFIKELFSNSYQQDFAKQLTFSLLAVLALIVLKRTDVLKLSLKGVREGASTISVLIVLYGIILLNFIINHDPITASVPEIILFVVQMLLVGFSEEILFRGIVQNAVMDFTGRDTVISLRKGLIISGSIFGLVHLTNMFVPGISAGAAFVQAVSVIPVGIMFGTVYFRSRNNIWLCTLIHAVIDLTAFLNAGVLSGITENSAINTWSVKNLISVVIPAAMVVCAMRKEKLEETIAVVRA